VAQDAQALARATKMFVDVTPSDPNAGPDVFRANFESMCEQFPLPGDARIESVDADGVPGLIVHAPGASKDRLIIFVHGGGGVIGSANAYRPMAYQLSAATGAAVLLPDYRLAPENPHPAQLDDVVTALRWAARTTPPAQTILAGDSAGGGFAASALLVLKDAGDPLPAAVVLMAPWVDWTNSAQSLTDLAGIDPLISKEMTDGMRAACLQNGEDPAHWRVSALHGELSGLPPFWITAGTCDALKDDSVRLAQAVNDGGGSAELTIVEDMIHVYPLFASFLPEGKQAIDQIGRFVNDKALAAAS
jgi:monoterpene epsilon-lactone hydrolase